jgi:hypothetical protein
MGDIPSKKNSKRIVSNKRSGRPMLISSHNYMSWEKSVLTQLSGVPKVIE